MINPVLRRENKTILRTWKTYISIMAYILILLSVASFIVYVLYSNSIYSGLDPQSFSAMYIVLSGAQLGMMLLIVPALTGASISGERERQTLDLMLTTKMTPFSIIWGKMVSSIIVALIMIIAAIPIFAMCLFYGSVSVVGVLWSTAFTLIMSFFSGSIGIFFSTIFKKTVVSIVVSFITILCFSLLPFAAVGIWAIINQFYPSDTAFSYVVSFISNYIILTLNPFAGFISVCDNQFGYSIIYDMLNSTSRYYNSSIILQDEFFMDISRFMWSFNLLVCALISCLFLFLSAHVINPIKRRKRR